MRNNISFNVSINASKIILKESENVISCNSSQVLKNNSPILLISLFYLFSTDKIIYLTITIDV